jgi:multidrug resistance efflux pump
MTDSGPDTTSPPKGDGTVAVLEEALWSGFFSAETTAEKARRWLAIQIRQMPEASAAVLVLEDGDGAFVPAAFWPDRETATPALAGAIEQAIENGRAAFEDGSEGSAALACPVMVDGVVAGAVGVVITGDRRQSLRRLQWGFGWIEALVRNHRMAEIKGDGRRMESLLESMAILLSQSRYRQMAEITVGDLARRLDCEMVAFGLRRRLSTRVKSISNTADFKQRMNLMRDLGAAMDEAIDQNCLIAHPPPETGEAQVVSRAHETLAQSNGIAHVLTVPFEARGCLRGAFTFERRSGHPFDQDSLELCDCIAAVLGPYLYAAARDERWIGAKLAESIGRTLRSFLGRGHLGRKILLVLLLGLSALFCQWEQDFTVTSDARVEGRVQRVVAAPFEGYIASESARAGAVVAKGDILARIDDRDLSLERLRWTTTLRQRETEYSRALAEGSRVDANVLQSQIEQAEAQVALVDEQLSRTVLKAPIGGVVVAGDLSQRIGSSVSRGEELFTVAPIDDYRVVLLVAERDAGEMAVGQRGQILVAALPGEPLSYDITEITPINTVVDGQNVFRVEAALVETAPALRPGMEGVAKTAIERRLVISNWTRGLRDWLRMTLWRWKIWND